MDHKMEMERVKNKNLLKFPLTENKNIERREYLIKYFLAASEKELDITGKKVVTQAITVR